MKRQIITLLGGNAIMRLWVMNCGLWIMGEAFAGGYLTNTNQSINFLRNPARDAAIGIDGVYYNPAGVSFMNDGWHLQFNWQMVHQHRDSWSDYQLGGLGYDHLFKYNTDNPVTEETDYMRKSKGRVNVPIQPSLFLDYNKNGWAFQFGFGFIGGGGGCEFEDGLGAFEYLAAASGISALKANGLSMAGYSLESYMKGESYDLGFTLGAARKISNQISAYVGMRGIWAINQYEGYLKNIKYTASNGLTVPTNDLVLDCGQTGFGLAPILGVDFKLNDKLNFAAKYEFRTALTVKSDANNNDAFNALASQNATFGGYVDGAESRADLPAMLSVGVQYSPLRNLDLCAGYHHYFDTDTKQWSESGLENTNEFTLGAQYRLNKKLEISGGYQKTIYDQPSDFHTDMSFSLDSYSIGCGIGYKVSENITLNAAYFQTIYSNYDQQQALTTSVSGQEIPIGSKNVTYSRTNKVIGIGVEVSF